MEFLVGIRPIVPDRSSKESLDSVNRGGNYLPLDPQPAVVDAHLAFVRAEDAAEAAELYIRFRGTVSAYPVKLVVFGPGADLEVDIQAAAAQEPAPA